MSTITRGKVMRRGWRCRGRDISSPGERRIRVSIGGVGERETEKVRGIEKVERGKKERGIVEGDRRKRAVL